MAELTADFFDQPIEDRAQPPSCLLPSRGTLPGKSKIANRLYRYPETGHAVGDVEPLYVRLGIHPRPPGRLQWRQDAKLLVIQQRAWRRAKQLRHLADFPETLCTGSLEIHRARSNHP